MEITNISKNEEDEKEAEMMLHKSNEIHKTYIHEGIVYEIDDPYENDIDQQYKQTEEINEKRKYEPEADSQIKAESNKKNRRRTDENGQEWILKETSLRLVGFDTGLAAGEKWFKVSERDENMMFWITSILGTFGVHKLINGEFGAFIGYLLTCGGFGVFGILDVLQFLTGSAGYEEVQYIEDDNTQVKRKKERVYYRRLSNMWVIPVGLICACVVTFSSLNLIYKPLIRDISKGLQIRAVNMDQEKAYEDLKVIENILGNGFEY